MAERLAGAGFAIRPIHGSHQLEVHRRDYVDAVEAATRAANVAGLTIQRRAQIGDRVWDCVPLSHLRPGMHVLVDDGSGGFVPTRVDEVDTVVYDGPVYDLEVDGTHNFVAEHICVRNSIYKFPRSGHEEHPRVRERLS